MEESILLTIKKMLGGGAENNEHFDNDIITHINSAFMVLTQVGVGPKDGFFISDDTAVWSDFVENPKKYQAIKTYIYSRVKLVFDPPTTSAVIEVLNQTIRELEWRLQVNSDEESEVNESG